MQGITLKHIQCSNQVTEPNNNKYKETLFDLIGDLFKITTQNLSTGLIACIGVSKPFQSNDSMITSLAYQDFQPLHFSVIEGILHSTLCKLFHAFVHNVRRPFFENIYHTLPECINAYMYIILL